MEAYRIQKIAEQAGVSARQLRYWDNTGLVKPSVKEAAGKGSARLYSEEDAAAARAIRALREKGISLQKIRRAVAQLERRMPKRYVLSECALSTDGRSVFVTEKDKLVDVSSEAQLALPLGMK